MAALSAADYDFLRPSIQFVELVHQTVLVEAGAPIPCVYFPHDGIISLVVRLEQGQTVEAAMVGKDGAYGVAAALDGKISLSTAIVQLAGTASTVDVGPLRKLADKSPSFRAMLMRHEQVIYAQALQSAACNASHTVQSRLSRWLLRARDLSDSDTLVFTQEYVAQMLGAQRNSVSIVANTLQQAGLIRYSRGKVEIINLEGLHDMSCECYATVKGLYGTLFADQRPPSIGSSPI